MDTCINMSDLVGLRAKFYGVDNNMFKLGKVVFEAIEDENDGYRSSLQCVRIVPKENMVGAKGLLAEVTITEIDDDRFGGWALIDDLGYCWLKFGTDNRDDYYPSFIFDYSPKEAFMGTLKDAIQAED